jgi:WD40 repeat protein
LAAAEVVHEKRGAVPTVSIYEVATGVKLARVEHEPVTSNPFMNASFGIHGIEFTPDGKYLVTSTHDTKVWALGDLINN